MDEFFLDEADLLALQNLESESHRPTVENSQQSRQVKTGGNPSSARLTDAGASTNSRSTPSANKILQPVPRKLADSSSSSTTIIVSPRQKDNPIVKHIKNIQWELGDIIPDYLIASSIAVLFLSLKYHRLHPEYIYNRITKLGKNFKLRVLLVVVDIENHAESIKELTKTSVVNDITIFLAWSSVEAGYYISQFGVLKSAAPTFIQGTQKEDYGTRMVNVLTSIRGVNKSDAASLISTFGSIKLAVGDGGRTASNISGWGDVKVNRFRRAITEPFVARKRLGSKFRNENAVNTTGPPKTGSRAPRQNENQHNAAANIDNNLTIASTDQEINFNIKLLNSDNTMGGIMDELKKLRERTVS
ncbi:restriction endonuclease type II-like protein [Lipomyces japonicus]|uniref:restriction endonuclease type II-like protein n=1 Tax=Lipomyces japonicus TaxID=56871 RepID=UPI0034CED5B2